MDGVAHGTTGLSSSPDSFGFQADILITEVSQVNKYQLACL